MKKCSMPLAALRGLFAAFSLATVLLVAGCIPAGAEGLRPYEPFNPAKAQSLPTSPLAIQSGGQQHYFEVEVATTPEQRNIGLMHRDSLAPDRGMLFDFQVEQPERFWMRNTFISLDMLFVRKSGEIVFIARDTIPHSDRPVGPSQPVQAVLELPAGTAARLGIRPGDVVRHTIFGNPPQQ